MNKKTIFIGIVLALVVIIYVIYPVFTNLINFSQVTDLEVKAFVNTSEDRTPNGIIFMPLLKKDRGEVLEQVLEWSNVPVPFDIEIYTIKYPYEPHNYTTKHDRLVYKESGLILNSRNMQSGENLGIYVPYTDMDFSHGYGAENYGLANVTAHLPDGRTITATDVRTDFPSQEDVNLSNNTFIKSFVYPESPHPP